MNHITIRPDPHAVDDILRFADMVRRASPLVEADMLRELGDIVARAAADNFSGERSAQGAWRPLAPATVSERMRLGYGGEHPILVRTGEYRESFTGGAGWAEESTHQGNVWRLSFGSDDYRAAWHEYGGYNLPARPVLLFGEDTETRIEAGVMRVYDNMERRTRG
jgi:phage gpG-like protein